MFDSDKSNAISASEFKNVCTALDLKIDDNDLHLLVNEMDKDKSGSIEFDEFCSVMAKQFFKTPTKAELEEAFNHFDKGFC
jgi:Ca2+-binding EF-hand superfamily protein